MRWLLWAAMVCGAASTAQAADMPDLPILRGSFTDGLTNSRTNWQGYYVGGQGSYGNAVSRISPGINGDLIGTFTPPAGIGSYTWQALGDAQGRSAGYGAFAGYNSQWDDVVVGIEANYIHFGFKPTSSATGFTYDGTGNVIAAATNSATVGISDFGSLRLRAAYAAGCFLPYAFIGGGVGYQTVDRFASADPASALPAPTTYATKSKLVYGYSAGVGFDVMLVGGLFARGEYEFQRVTSDIETNINTVRAGLGYKF